MFKDTITLSRTAVIDYDYFKVTLFTNFFYLARGECTAFISHNIYKFHHGDIVIVPAGTIHKTDYTGKGMHERIVISFKPTVTEWLNNVVGTDIVSDVMQAGVISIPEKRRDYIESLLEKLLFENEGQDILSPAFIRTGLIELVLFIIRCRRYEEML